MVLVQLAALLSIFLAVAIAVHSFFTARGHTMSLRGVGGGTSVDRSEIPSLAFRLLFPYLDRLAPLFQRVTWPRYRAKASLNLQRAGIGRFVSPNHLLAMKAVFAVGVPVVVAQLFPIFWNPALFLLASFLGFLLPDRLVTDLRKAREAQILSELPGAVDVLSLSVEAGLEFMTAMQRIVERGSRTALRDEMATILNDIRLGSSRADALKSFSFRVEIPEVSSFVSVLVQADLLGASIGPVLQHQAERMRVERFQRGEKAGAVASQKILVPLVLFIFPAVLIVLLGPIALQFIYGPPQ
jgi:tight adherence protein C